MISIQIELLPGRAAHLRRPIASVRISNLSDLADRSDYGIDILEAQPARRHAAEVRQHQGIRPLPTALIWALFAKAVEEFEEL